MSNAGPAGRVHEPGLRLGVVHHGVRREEPERAGPDCVGRRHQAGVAAGVRRHGEAVPAVAAGLERDRGLPLLEQRRDRSDVGLGRETHERAAHGRRSRSGRRRVTGDLLQAAAEVAELEALEDGADRLDRQRVAAGRDDLDQVVLERHVTDHGRQLQREARGGLVLREQRAPLV